MDKKFRRLSILIIFSVFLCCSAYSSSPNIIIHDGDVPLGKNYTAYYYISTATPSLFVSVLSDSILLGKGSIMKKTVVINNPDSVDKVLGNIPDTSKILEDGEHIEWHSIYYIIGKYKVYGRIVKDNIIEEEYLSTQELETEYVEEETTPENADEDIIEASTQVDNPKDNQAPIIGSESSAKISNPLNNTEYNNQVNALANSISTEKTMYFSANGNDNNSGLDKDHPKKDPTSYIKKGNITVLLKSGDTFSFDHTIYLGSNVVISTYGGNSYAAVSLIQKSTSSFEVYDTSNDIYCADLNENVTDTGWISTNKQINWKRVMSFELTNNDEYYVDQTNKKLYIKSNNNLIGKHYLFATSNNIFELNRGNNCLIEKLEVVGSGRHGISILGYNNIVVRNCYVHDIGGGLHITTGSKYGNGIQIWSTETNNVYIYNNYVTDCFDAGITAQIDSTAHKDSNNIVFANNAVERCNYNFEFFQRGAEYCMKNIVVANNIFRDAEDITNGYRLNQSKTDYTALFCLWNNENPNTNVTIKNNFAVSSQAYGISLFYKTSYDTYSYENNNIIVQNITEPIKNKKNYTGDDNQCYGYLAESEEFISGLKAYDNFLSNFNTLSVYIYPTL